MINDLIVLEQEPIIRQRLETIKGDIEKKVAEALAVPCTAESCIAVKKIRAELNRDFEDFENRRKEIKNKLLEPYKRFNEIYEECVPSVYKPALATLSERVNTIDEVVKEDKRAKLTKYFDELCESKSVDFVKFSDANINVTKSVSEKILKEQAKAFVERVASDIDMIKTLEDCNEVMIEYKGLGGNSECYLNASEAIKTVTLRHKAMKEEAQTRLRATLEENAQREREEAIKAIVKESEEFKAPVEVEISEATPPSPIGDTSLSEGGLAAEDIVTTSFKVRATLSKLKELKEFLIQGGYEIL